MCQRIGNLSSLDCAELAGGNHRTPGTTAHCPRGQRHGVFIGERGLAITRARPTPAGTRTRGSSECVSGGSRAPVLTIDPDANGIYAPLDVLLLRLLDDTHLRAPSADCAQAVWNPLFAHRLYRNVDEVLKWKLKAALSTERALAAHASSTSASAASAGEDGTHPAASEHVPHLHEEHQDMGMCGSPLGVYWPNDVVLTYWGDTTCHPADTRLIVLPGGVRRNIRLERTADRWISLDVELVRIAQKAYSPSRCVLHSHRPLCCRVDASAADAAHEHGLIRLPLAGCTRHADARSSSAGALARRPYHHRSPRLASDQIAPRAAETASTVSAFARRSSECSATIQSST